MDPQISLRVVRGPDWNYGDQDGGECCLGTVVAVKAGREDNKVAVVFWDNGSRGEYRCGEDGKYDLRVLESSPAGEKRICITQRLVTFNSRLICYLLQGYFGRRKVLQASDL